MIEITSIQFKYPQAAVPALSGINLCIKKGALFGLLGPNGAGKSTLLQLLSGLLPLQTGDIQISGTSLKNIKNASSPRFSLVPQEYAFYNSLTARENLNFFGGILGLSGLALKDESTRCLGLTSLDDRADQRAGQFSGGLKRRLNLAIGLMNRPEVIFLDEPTVGIDAQSRNFILERIRELNASGTTVVYTSHYMEEVESLCTDIAILDHGKIVITDTVDALTQDSSSQWTVQLENPVSDNIEKKLVGLFHVQWSNDRQHIIFDGVGSQCTANQIIEFFAKNSISVRDVKAGKSKKLENIYLDLTQRALRD